MKHLNLIKKMVNSKFTQKSFYSCRLLAVGIVIINMCISNVSFAQTATGTITVNPNVTAGVVSGTTPLCIGATATYTSSGTPGGSWTSGTPAVATVVAGTGVVTAVSAGTSVITYTVSSGCGSPVSATKTVTVSPNVTAGVVSGTTPLCIGATATYTSSGTPGGSWTSGTPAVATVVAGTGVITAVSAGTSVITYTVSSGCGSPVSAFQTLTVSPNNTITLTSAVGTDAQTLCINTAITNIMYSTTGATGATFSGLPAGVTGSWAANVVTISGIPTASGTLTYTITLTGGCP